MYIRTDARKYSRKYVHLEAVTDAAHFLGAVTGSPRRLRVHDGFIAAFLQEKGYCV